MGQITDFTRRLMTRVASYALCAVIGAFVGLYVAVRLLLGPLWPSGGDPPVAEDTPPACLSDPDLGTHGYLQTRSVRLHYVEKGDRSNPLMLCFHGFPEFWYSWRHILKAFSSDYWVVAVDMRGYGDSDKPLTKEQYKMTYLVEDMKDCIKALGREKCTLVAHDWGGLIAWNFLLLNPQHIDSYIIMNSAHPIAFRDVLYRPSYDQLIKSWYAFLFQSPKLPEYCLLMNNLERLSMGFRSNSITPVSDGEIEPYKYTFKKPGALTCGINYYRANFMLEDVCEMVQGLGRKPDFPPGLVLYGERDIYLNKETQELSAALVANASLVCIKDANHFIPQDNPEAVIKEMSLFLSRISSKKHRHS